MPTETIEKLQGIADERGVKVNALVNDVLERFLNWGVFAERYGMVTLSKEAYRSLLDEIDVNRVPDVAEKAVNYTKEFALLKFRKFTPEVVLSVLQDYSSYANLGITSMNKDGDEIVITTHHPHGLKHSLLAKAITENLLEEVTGSKPEIMITENIAVCRVKQPRASEKKAKSS